MCVSVDNAEPCLQELRVKQQQLLTVNFSPSNTEVSTQQLHKAPLNLYYFSQSAVLVSVSPTSCILHSKDTEALEHQAAVLWLQAECNALLHLLAAPQEAAAVPGQLLPGSVAVLLFLSTAGEKLLHIVTKTNLRGGRAVSLGSVQQSHLLQIT